jgi:membrane fusion protein (multidrug efflux system)
MRKLILIAITGAMLIQTSCKEKKQSTQTTGMGGSNGGPLPVEAMVVKPTSVSQTVEVTGNILPFESTEIRSEISGRITALNIQEGAFVSKGALLVKLFDGDLQAQLKKLQVQLQIAEKTEERQRELLKISGISQQDYDLSLLSVNNLKADLDLIRVSITKTEIRAPYSGRMGLRNISMGAYITPSNLLTTISQVEEVKVEFSVPEKYSAQIRNGMVIRFTLEGVPTPYSARVVATESRIEENTRNLRIRAIVSGKDKNLIPGNFAKVQVILGRDDNALMVPTEAIIPQARNKQLIVYKGGKASFQTVITGVRDSTLIQVVDGIKAGDTVITTGLLFLKPQADVKLTKIK